MAGAFAEGRLCQANIRKNAEGDFIVKNCGKATCALIFLGISISMFWCATRVQAQEQLPYDRHAIFVTHVAHVNTHIDTKSGGPAGTIQPPNPAVIVGPEYKVASVVKATTSVPAAEEEIAADPRNASNLVAAISDFSQRGGFNTTKYSFSLNNGAAWKEAFVPTNGSGSLTTSDGNVWDANSDPVVVIDNAGHVYLSSLYLDAVAVSNGLYVGVGTLDPTGGVSFMAFNAVATNPSLSPNFSEDKPWIAVDNSSSAFTGNVYASWTRFVGNSLTGLTSDSIVFSRSTNLGNTWSSSPMRISLAAQDGAVQGSQVAVGHDGTVYVAYEVFYVGGKRQHFMAKSMNGGASFNTPVAITPFFNDLTFKSTYRKNSFAAMAASPANGDVFVVYSDQPSSTLGAQIEFIHSVDGSNFTKPVAINDNSNGQQFFPAIATDSLGSVHVSWFDTRNAKGSSQYDIYATYSKDNGSTFGTNARVTPSLINAGRSSFIGDYAGIAAGIATSGTVTTTFAHPVWTSGGFNNGTLQTATLTLP